MSLDVIRGIAVLGMIFINILVFVPDINEFMQHDLLLGYTTTEGSIYRVIYILFNGKMRAMFALLFGAGIILFFQTNNAASFSKSDQFARRMFWLLTFGLIHAYILLWPGSILFEYAVCGLLLFTFRHVAPKMLMLLSVIVLGFYTYINSADYPKSYAKYTTYMQVLEMEKAHQGIPVDLYEKKQKFEMYLENFLPLSDAKKKEVAQDKQEKIKTYTGNIAEIYRQNIGATNEALSFGVYLNILESIGTMLLGMALFKLGFFDYTLKKGWYIFLILAGIPIGIYAYDLLYSWQVQTRAEVLDLYSWKFFSSFIVDAPARILLSLGYCALLAYLCQLTLLKPALGMVAYVGRMAFSNYVGQTVICVVFFYFLQYYGSLSMTNIAVVAIGIISFQLVVSYCCIRYAGTGPLEYLWRKLAGMNLP
jgi:uncharacterized protein